MQLVPYTFDGTQINDGTYFVAKLLADGVNAWSQTPPQPQFAQRLHSHPKFMGIVGKEKYLTINIKLCRPGSYSTDRDTLAGLFDMTEWTSDLKTLVCRDSADSNRSWQVEAIPVGFQWSLPTVDVTLAIPDPRWRETTRQSDTWAMTTTNLTTAFTVRGNIVTLPKFEITPTSSRTGNSFTYRRFITVLNPGDRSLGRQMWNLFNGTANNGLDTGALISTGKMQADGDDLVINLDGRRVNRYLQDINTTSTECWTRFWLSPRLYFTLGTAIASSGAITTIDITDTPTARTMLRRLPDEGVVKIDDELFTYTGKIQNFRTLQLTGVTRSVYGSAAAEHTTSDTVEWVEHAIWMLYGNPAATDPNSEYADYYAPMFNKTSENTRLDFDNFNSSRGLRSAEWKSHKTLIRPVYRRSIGDNNAVTAYNSAHSGTGSASLPAWADPGTYLGGAIMSYPQGKTYLETEGDIWWVFSHPVGITSVKLAGQKMVYSTDITGAHWPVLELMYSDNGKDWYTKATEAVPASTSTWSNFAINGAAQALGATYKYIAIHFKGTVAGGDVRNKAMFEVSDVEVTLNSTNAPTISLGAELTAQYEFQKVTITNTTTHEKIYIKDLVVNLNDTLVVDCENRRAYVSQNNANARQHIDTDVVRSRWMTLREGSNTLQLTDSGTGEMTIVTRWYGRNN